MSDVDQKNKENLSNHQDLPDLNATNILDSEAKEGEPQCHWSALRIVLNEAGACGGEAWGICAPVPTFSSQVFVCVLAVGRALAVASTVCVWFASFCS